MVRDGFIEEGTSEQRTSKQRLKGGEGRFRGNSVLARGNRRRYKDPRTEAWLACGRNSKKVSVAEEEREGDGVREAEEALTAGVRTRAFDQ